MNWIALCAAALAGSSAFAAALLLASFASRASREKRLRFRLDGVSVFGGSGFKGAAVLLAEKSGRLFMGLRFIRGSERVRELVSLLKRRTSLLGHPFDAYSAEAYAGFHLLCGAGAAAVSCCLFGPLNFFAPAAAAAGLAAPYFYISEKCRERRAELASQLPEFLEMLALVLEAGLDAWSALSRTAASSEGALYREFAAARREVSLGRPKTEALEAMAVKNGHPQLSAFVKALNASFASGGSLLPAVKSLAAQFRAEQSQEAERLAGQAPLKLMFPLILFIFPTVFIILFGPVLLAFLTGKIQ